MTRLLAPITLVGRTALSVEIKINWRIPQLRAALQTTRAVHTLLASPDNGLASTSGTCLQAAAGNNIHAMLPETTLH